MVEAAVFLIVVFMLAGFGLIVWRSLRGPAQGRRGTLRRVVILSLAMTPLVAVPAWQLSKSRDFQILGKMVAHVETSIPVVALTFDDGPHPDSILNTYAKRLLDNQLCGVSDSRHRDPAPV